MKNNYNENKYQKDFSRDSISNLVECLLMVKEERAGCPHWTDSIFKRKGTPSYSLGELLDCISRRP